MKLIEISQHLLKLYIETIGSVSIQFCHFNDIIPSGGRQGMVNSYYQWQSHKCRSLFPRSWFSSRVLSRFFDPVGHETTNASSGNKHFFSKSCHCQTYQNYEQSRQKLGTILGNKAS